MIAVTGYRTTIVCELQRLVPADEKIIRCPPLTFFSERYVFAAGLLPRCSVTEQTWQQITSTMEVNMASVISSCEHVIKQNDHARICVVGSDSGIRGSYNEIYAAAKAGLHQYVRTRRLMSPRQQLVAVAPSIIEDSGMTRRRTDTERLDARRNAHPKGRFLQAIEVARMIHFLLYVDEGYITNTVIEMRGEPR